LWWAQANTCHIIKTMERMYKKQIRTVRPGSSYSVALAERSRGRRVRAWEGTHLYLYSTQCAWLGPAITHRVKSEYLL